MGIYLGPFRFTKRGVRVRIGPRIARLHVGAGGTGVSTGAGPFTIYKRVGGKHRGSRVNGDGEQVKLGRRCRYCHAQPGQWCVTNSGHPAAQLHGVR